MSGPSSPWRLCSSAPSSVTQWLLYRTVLITVLFALASSSDWCNHLQSDFTGHMQTIGPLDGRLWAITTEWTVHEMTPCDKGNETLSLCMEIGFPVQVDTKWPELAKSVKENANVTDFNFTVDNSVFMNSSDNVPVLIMHGIFFKPQKYFGFNFTANTSIKNYVFGGEDTDKALWISSDQENKASSLDLGKKLKQIRFSKFDELWKIASLSSKNICKVNNEGDLSLRITTDKCDHGEMDWTVLKAVRYGGQFYFFAKDKVYIFAAVENVDTKVYTLSYDKFIHCKEPTNRQLSEGLTTKGTNKTIIWIGAWSGVAFLINASFFSFILYRKVYLKKPDSQARPNKKANSQAGPLKYTIPPIYAKYADTETFIMARLVTSEPDVTTAPAVRRCKACNDNYITTVIDFSPGLCTWIASVFALPLGGCLFPFFIDCAKDVLHLCPDCGSTIATLHRSEIIMNSCK